MTTVFFRYFSVRTSAAQAIAADDLLEKCHSAVSESVCQPDTTMQQHTEEGAVTLTDRGNGKLLGKRIMLRLHGTSITDGCTKQFYCFPSHSFMKIWNQIKTLQLLHQCTESFMVSLIYEGLMSWNFLYIAWVALYCFGIVKVLDHVKYPLSTEWMTKNTHL